MKLDAAFFDLDGTIIIHPEKIILDSTVESIRKLKEKGVKIICSTGRGITEIRRLELENIPFDYFITLNGQLILDKDEKTIWENPFSGRHKEIIKNIFEKKNLPVMLVEKERMYINYIDDIVKTVHYNISTPLPEIGEYDGATLYQVIAYGEKEDVDALAALVPDSKAVYWTSLGIDLIPSNGGKETGIKALLDILSIDRKNTISFGDGDNDRSMLEYTQIGVAMANASDEVKKSADYVTLSCKEDGITAALRHFQLI